MKSTRLRISFVLFLSLIATAALGGQTDTEMGHISGDIFNKKAKWYHAYLSFSEVYDDNIFNTKEDAEQDLITVVSPGIQLTLPGTDQRAEDIVVDPTTPGGVAFGRFAENSFRRFRAYVGYAPSVEFYAENKDENIVNHYAQAGAQCNLKSGLSFDAIDRFDKTQDRRGVNISTQTDSYYSNLFLLITTFPISDKFQLQADYSNFQVRYSDEDKNGFRDRADNSGAGYFFYRFKPKTAAYFKYQHTAIAYENDSYRDGTERDLLLGIRWNYSLKTNFNIQAGYGIKSYEHSGIDESERFIGQLDASYQLSSKTHLALSGYHRNEESSVSAYDSSATTATSLRFIQMITHKIDFELGISYRLDDYKSTDAAYTGIPARKDRTVRATPSLSFAFQPWLSGSLAYSYRLRDSDVESNAYTGNSVILKLTGSI